MKKISIVILSLLMLSCTDDQETSIFDMRVNHFRKTAIGTDKQLVFEIQRDKDIGSENWSNFFSEIQSFEYEPGYVYDLTVQRTSIDTPPADGASSRFSLISLNSKTKVADSTSFELMLKSVSSINPPGFAFGDSISGFTVLGEIPIRCNDLCSELQSSIDNENEVSGRFVHAQNDTISLVKVIAN